MIRKSIRKAKDGYRLRVWHTDRPYHWVRFIGLPDLQEARARQASAEQLYFNGDFTDDAGTLIGERIREGGGKGDWVCLIGRTVRLKGACTKNSEGGVTSTHRELPAALKRGHSIWVDLKDGRHRRVYWCRMDPTDLREDLRYVGGVLYWKDEKREPIGYCVNQGVLTLFYIGEPYRGNV